MEGDHPLPRPRNLGQLHAVPGAISGGVDNNDCVQARRIAGPNSDLHVLSGGGCAHAVNGRRRPVIAVRAVKHEGHLVV